MGVVKKKQQKSLLTQTLLLTVIVGVYIWLAACGAFHYLHTLGGARITRCVLTRPFCNVYVHKISQHGIHLLLV